MYKKHLAIIHIYMTSAADDKVCDNADCKLAGTSKWRDASLELVMKVRLRGEFN